MLEAINQAVREPWLQHVPAVEVLRRVWDEQYLAEAGVLRWREVKEIPSPSDEVLVPVVHAALARAGRLPAEHLVDAGYADASVLLESQRMYGVTLIGPVADDPSWQARSGQGLTKADFVVDWDRHVVTCPAGKQSIFWLPHTYPKTGMTWEARFARKDCTPCPLRPRGTRAKLGVAHYRTANP